MSIEEEIKRQIDQGQSVTITEEGELVSENQTTTAPDGTPINRITGERGTKLKTTRWYAWYESNANRLVAEKQAMQKRFPRFKLFETSKGLTWSGYLKPKGGNSYKVALTYPKDYPYNPPKVFILEPKVRAPKHQWRDGSLCLMHPSDGTWQTNTTAVTILAMASTWLWAYEFHERNCGCSNVPCKNWPGKEA